MGDTLVFQEDTWNECKGVMTGPESNKRSRTGTGRENWKQTWPHYVKSNGQSVCRHGQAFRRDQRRHMGRCEDKKNAGGCKRQGSGDTAGKTVKEAEGEMPKCRRKSLSTTFPPTIRLRDEVMREKSATSEKSSRLRRSAPFLVKHASGRMICVEGGTVDSHIDAVLIQKEDAASMTQNSAGPPAEAQAISKSNSAPPSQPDDVVYWRSVKVSKNQELQETGSRVDKVAAVLDSGFCRTTCSTLLTQLVVLVRSFFWTVRAEGGSEESIPPGPPLKGHLAIYDRVILLMCRL